MYGSEGITSSISYLERAFSVTNPGLCPKSTTLSAFSTFLIICPFNSCLYPFPLTRNAPFSTCSPQSPAVHPEDEKAEEHCDAHQGDSGWCGEKLPVVDAEVPHHSQHHHKHGHHQAAGAQGQSC